MQIRVFILISVIYITSLAFVDSLFNRLIFRENRKLSYFSIEKKKIYKLWEWKAIGVIFLTILPIMIPSVMSFALGGWKYVLTYLVILLIIPWDIIFGRLVFGNWFGDTPSVSLPVIGWIHISLYKSIAIRLLLAFIILFLLYLHF